jgi:ComF family protein
MITFLLNFIAPKKCVHCKKYGTFFCEECKNKVLKQEPYCYICKKPSLHFWIHTACKKQNRPLSSVDKIIVYGHYNGSILKKVIQWIKFYKKKELVSDLGNILSNALRENESLMDKNKYVLVSPPMHFLRRWKRGYNHSLLLSEYISKNLWIEEASKVLQKKKTSKQQSKLHKYERLTNVKNSFQINKKYQKKIQNKVCIFVDDVVSTWATLWEIASVLISNRAKKVIGLIIASD